MGSEELRTKLVRNESVQPSPPESQALPAAYAVLPCVIPAIASASSEAPRPCKPDDRPAPMCPPAFGAKWQPARARLTFRSPALQHSLWWWRIRVPAPLAENFFDIGPARAPAAAATIPRWVLPQCSRPVQMDCESRPRRTPLRRG